MCVCEGGGCAMCVLSVCECVLCVCVRREGVKSNSQLLPLGDTRHEATGKYLRNAWNSMSYVLSFLYTPTLTLAPSAMSCSQSGGSSRDN